jgi:hypothetical protein
MIKRTERYILHGGHKGTEAEFGKLAEEWGLPETTLSFEGHKMERAKNVEVLDDDRLAEGKVSMEFVFQTMRRRFVEGKGLRRVIYSMFHLVVRTDELFAVGWIQDDETVKGGTGWGVELAKLFNRRVHVFDQDRAAWFTWRHRQWEPSEPRLPEGAFSATGTRNLTPAGRRAIRELFERSLGAAVAQTTISERAR